MTSLRSAKTKIDRRTETVPKYVAVILFGALLASVGCGSSDTGLGTTSPTTPVGTNSNSFDWGAPFFYGRNVYTSIDGSSAPNAPYWASTLNHSSVAASANNVLPVSVDGGPFISSVGIYGNGMFASVTVCLPGTSTCQTIGGILVDTGSYGLRLLSSSAGGALTLSLPQQVGSDGNPIAECTEFVDGYIWGPVQTADLQMAGESASSVPVQVVGDPNFAVIPTGCSSTGGTNEDNPSGLGANGILGVGPFPQDCGIACTSGSGTTPLEGTYYDCSSTAGCNAAFESLTAQVQNPVALFSKDNNGVILEMPGVSGGEASVNGALVFGIGTESNNALGSTPILTINTSGANTGDFTTTYAGTSLTGSFIDSGSNALFFDNSNIPECSDNSFYCPVTLLPGQTATQVGANGTSSTITFNVGNADTLFNSDSGDDAAFNGLAGPN